MMRTSNMTQLTIHQTEVTTAGESLANELKKISKKISREEIDALIASIETVKTTYHEAGLFIGRTTFDINTLPYDEEALQSVWYKRNPCQDIDDNGTDRFWKTAFMSFSDYVNTQTKNNESIYFRTNL